MCDPVTIGTVATVASGTLTAYGQYEQGRQAAAAANVNARQFENQAQRTRNAATEKENDHRRMVAEMVSRQRAQFGAAGVDLGSGSPLDITLDTQELGNIDALRIRKTADDEVQSLKDQAKFTKAEGKAAKRAGTMAAVGTLIGTAGSVAAKWKPRATPAPIVEATPFTG